MKRSNFAAAVALVLSVGAVTPAFAGEKGGDDSGLDKVVGGMECIDRVAGVGAGTVVGTPIAAVRQTVKAYRDWTPDLADKMGGKDCGPCCAIVSLVTLPAACAWGVVTGPYYGVKNGFSHGFNNPFTHQSFSLDADYDGGK